jgi:hypothetical protein
MHSLIEWSMRRMMWIDADKPRPATLLGEFTKQPFRKVYEQGALFRQEKQIK